MALIGADKESVQYLAYLTEKGMRERYPEVTDELLARLREELRVITKSGFTDYFLIVGDFMQWCKKNGIATGPARGSAGGSAVAYCLHITNVEPIQYGLIFERFLNDERVAMPDIDMDICWARRQEALEYLVQKYGEDRVAQIITFGTLSAKALLQDAGRVLKIPTKDIEELKKLIPDGEKIKYVDLVENEAFIKKLHEVAEKEPRIIEAMLTLEGLYRHGSVHAGGVIISKEKMIDLAPTYKNKNAVRPVVQYEMFDAEAVGLLKIDALGLRTVTHVDWAEKTVQRIADPSFDINNVPFNRKEAFDIINAGDTHGIFQLDGTGITKFAQEMIIESFNDITALLALYRPGPLDSGMAEKYIKRKNGLEATTFPHPDLQEVLKDTYGIIIYQEQVMKIMQVIGGFTLGQADVARKAMGKKKKELMDAELAKFATGARAKGYADSLIEELSAQIETFARYGFNKSHAVAYAMITYQTAYLKAKYPVAFYSAWLNITDDGTKKGWIIDQAARKGIKILPPDINSSEDMFTAMDENTIRFGLSAVKGMGKSFVVKTLTNRETKGPYASYFDFCVRMTSIPVDKKEALVASGAFDFDQWGHRGFLFQNARTIALKAKGKTIGNTTPAEFYSSFDQAPELTPLEMGELEKEYVNFYITDDPIKGIQEEIRMLGGQVGTPVTELRGEPVIGGRIIHVHTLKTKKGDEMAFVDVDDGIEQHAVTMFPSVWKRVKPHMQLNTYTAMRCELGKYRGQPVLQAVTVFPVDLNNRDTDLVLDLGYAPNRMTLAMVKMILDKAEQGTNKVYLSLSNDKYKFMLRSQLYQIKVTGDIISELKDILGQNALALRRVKE